MSNKYSELYLFVDRAAKNRKYPESTTSGLRAALKLFESALNPEEKDSIDIFKKNLSMIYQSVCTKNANKFNAKSLAVYKSRVLKVISDFESYGIDPTKMANWNPKVVKRGTRVKAKSTSLVNASVSKQESAEDVSVVGVPGNNKIELALRGDGTKFIISVPGDMTSAECAILKTLLDSIAKK